MESYVEKMAVEIHIDCVHESPGDQYEILKATEKLINQIIADTKRACLESLNRVNKFSGRPFTSYGDVIEEAEVKER